MEDDILRPLSRDELEKLLQIYDNDKPEHIQMYFLIINQMDWDDKIEKMDPDVAERISVKCRNKFYTHRHGNLEKNGTFISITGKEVNNKRLKKSYVTAKM